MPEGALDGRDDFERPSCASRLSSSSICGCR